jgi:transposase
VIDEYLDGKGSYRKIAFKYHISNNSVVIRWVKDYNSHGIIKSTPNGGGRSMTKGRKTKYDERVEVVSYCIENGHDYGKTVEKYNVSYQQIYSWVKKYEIKGAEGLTDRRGVRKDEASMTELEKLKAKNKLLEAQKRELEMENDVLKKFEEVKRGNR